MKQTFNKSLLALVCAVGLASAPLAFAAEEEVAQPVFTKGNVAKLIVFWEIASLLHMVKRGSKADFKQRAFHDMSSALLKKNAKQWAKNIARNLEISQSDYFEGQAYKGSSLKLNHEGKLEQGKKCFPHGFNGNLLGWIAAINKSNKSIKDLALLVFTLKAVSSSKVLKYLGWNDTTTKKEDPVVAAIKENTTAVNRQAAAQETYNQMTNHLNDGDDFTA